MASASMVILAKTGLNVTAVVYDNQGLPSASEKPVPVHKPTVPVPEATAPASKPTSPALAPSAPILTPP
jgi:hypothetical protein